jgi:hypothetical protein
MQDGAPFDLAPNEIRSSGADRGELPRHGQHRPPRGARAAALPSFVAPGRQYVLTPEQGGAHAAGGGAEVGIDEARLAVLGHRGAVVAAAGFLRLRACARW